MIVAQGVQKRFGAVTALRDFNLHVPEGSVFALLGPNGAGKTTALRILLNILRPGKGTARVLGADSRRLGPAELARIGYVSESRELPDWMRVREFFDYCRAFYPDWHEKELHELTCLFQLPPGRRLRDLSRGMRMKAALAAALAYRPRLLILDEPFSGLDVLVREQLMECIAERTAASTVLIATHDLSDMESFATHVAYLAQGRIQFSEEMDGLSARFREIEAAVPLSADTGAALPPNWLNLKRASGMVRFTDVQYDEQACGSELRRRWPEARDVTVRPLSLRSIFIALASRHNSENQPCD